MSLIFWTSLLTLAYIYVGYPLLVWILAWGFGRAPRRAPTTPTVSLLIPAYNEEAHIAQKIRNSLALDYPSDRLEIVVANDGSTDRTREYVQRFVSQGVKQLLMPGHVGKCEMLNRTLPHLQGELIVFSDASSELEPQALRQLVRNFADTRVGCVSGLYRLKSRSDLRAEGEGLYWTYETFIKRHESLLHSILGAHGAFYAIRTSLFTPLEQSSINDDYLIPMRIVAQGYRAVYEPTAVAWEREAASLRGEFARRCRIAVGNCQQLVALRHLLNPLRGWVALCFFSHKVLRTIAPLLLFVVLVCSAGLPLPWSVWAIGMQALLYGSALAGYVCQRRGKSVRWLSPFLYFCLGNLAVLAGVLKYCFKRHTPAWERAR